MWLWGVDSAFLSFCFRGTAGSLSKCQVFIVTIPLFSTPCHVGPCLISLSHPALEVFQVCWRGWQKASHLLVPISPDTPEPRCSRAQAVLPVFLKPYQNIFTDLLFEKISRDGRDGSVLRAALVLAESGFDTQHLQWWLLTLCNAGSRSVALLTTLGTTQTCCTCRQNIYIHFFKKVLHLERACFPVCGS